MLTFGYHNKIRNLQDPKQSSQIILALVKAMQEANQDPGYWQRVAKVEGLFVDGSVHDVVMRIM